jgi:hypothetical protein
MHRHGRHSRCCCCASCVHFAALRAQGIAVPLAMLADPFGWEARLRRTAWQDDAIAELAAGARCDG